MATGSTDPFSGLSRDLNIETVDHQLLSPEDVKEVVSALNPVEHHWRMIGKHLRISSRVLDKIEKNPRHRHNTANFVVEMVQQWLSLNYNYDRLGLPCWKLLVMAVAKGSGDNTYALQMAKKYRYPWKPVSKLTQQTSETDSIFNPVDEDDKQFILENLSSHDISCRWAHIARRLCINMHVVHDILEMDIGSMERFERLFSAWIERNTTHQVRSQATWEELLDAMAAPDGGNNLSLAIKLAKEKNIKWSPYPNNFPDKQDNSSEDVPNLDAHFKGLPGDSLGGDNSSPSDSSMSAHGVTVAPDSPWEVRASGKGTTGSSHVPRATAGKEEQQPRRGVPVPPPHVLFKPYPVAWDPNVPNSRRGFAVIFSIQHYRDPVLFRKGAEKDLTLFKTTFSHLGYEVLVYRDEQCTGQGIHTILGEIRTRVKKSRDQYQCPHDSFVCCITAHGNLDSNTQEEYIVPYDYDTYLELPKIFLPNLRKQLGANFCPDLAAKPKLFFVQACRGNAIPPAVKLQPQTDSISIHDDSDFFFSYSTRMNDASCRDTAKGSWYCQELSQVFLSDATHYYDVCTLVTEVHQRVLSNHTLKDFRQCPELTHTLRKRFFFHNIAN